MSELFSPNFWQIKTFGDARARPARRWSQFQIAAGRNLQGLPGCNLLCWNWSCI